MSSYETSELSCVLYDKACCLLGMLGISGTMTLPIIIVPLCSHIVVPLLFSMRRGWVCSDSPDGLWLPSAHYNFLVASVVGLNVFSVLPHIFRHSYADHNNGGELLIIIVINCMLLNHVLSQTYN